MVTNEKLRKIGFRAQSAMEYLMTYGWAILIIAIVLGALFSLGVFSTNAFITTSCIAASGYECSGPVLHAGVFNAVVGQATGNVWTSANIFFVTGGGAPGSSPGAFANTMAACVYYSYANSITNGGTVTLSVNEPVVISGGTLPGTCGTNFLSTVGTTYSGTVWAQYTTSAVSGFQYAQLATATLRAT